ncbi:MAG: alpha-L-rhamnosidase C-terminal domain-containing protein [Acidobacteriota bacterium]
MRAFAGLFLFFASLNLLAQTPDARTAPDPPQRTWHASWITDPAAPLREPLVLHFRRDLKLDAVPASYVVRVSADNRFILFVNGKRVGDGPARGDLTHWRYERYDLAPYLRAGENVITATVWNFGVYAPVAQMSDRTAFLLESEATGKNGISTPGKWMVAMDPGRKPLGRDTVTIKGYMAAGPGEELDGTKEDWDWDKSDKVAEWQSGRHGDWVKPGDPMRESIYPGTNHAHSADVTGDNPWGLVPDGLPHMEYRPTKAGSIVRTQGPVVDAAHKFPDKALAVPAHSRVQLLFDRHTLTTAYPQLTVSGGKGARIKMTYSEALYDNKLQKGDRDSLTYKDANGNEHPRQALGLTDLFLPDGGADRTFEPLWWRTWRYLDLDITTGDQPLTLQSLKAEFSAYPFKERAKLQTGDADLDKIWQISWRTARLDAHETYMDTPYWEQLQYIGDTRIQALMSYAVTGDDRLGRQAIEAFNESRIPEGITRSRYPSSLPQNIPTFSLLYIGMLHDWWMYRPDPTPVRDALEGTRGILDWFAQYQRPDGLLGKLPWWSFIDWVSKGETPTYSAGGESCITTLEYLGALNDAAGLEQALGDPHIAAQYRERAAHVRSGLYARCWSPQRKLLADNPDKNVFSQQANILGVLYDVIPKAGQKNVMRRMLAIEPGTTPDGILSASYYFRFYLARALDHAGLADDYLQSLDPWRKLLPLHFSTWPETPGETRSDSHAWSAHPIYDLLTLVAGVEPASPGFKTVRIAPHLGELTSLSATYPHPLGDIQVKYQRRGTHLDATVTLPGKLSGHFDFGGKTFVLRPGLNHISAP